MIIVTGKCVDNDFHKIYSLSTQFSFLLVISQALVRYTHIINKQTISQSNKSFCITRALSCLCDMLLIGQFMYLCPLIGQWVWYWPLIGCGQPPLTLSDDQGWGSYGRGVIRGISDNWDFTVNSGHMKTPRTHSSSNKSYTCLRINKMTAFRACKSEEEGPNKGVRWRQGDRWSLNRSSKPILPCLRPPTLVCNAFIYFPQTSNLFEFI